MNKNEAKRKLLRLFVPVVFCMIGVFSVQTRAEDAFVVEEEAVIGGESVQEMTPSVAEPVQRPAAPEEKKAAMPKKSKASKKIENESETGGAQAPVSVSENVVSQNSVSTPFRIPERKQETRSKEEDADRQKEMQSREHAIPEEKHASPKETEAEVLPVQEPPWWLLGVGGVFFLGGCARIAWRVVGRNRIPGENSKGGTASAGDIF